MVVESPDGKVRFELLLSDQTNLSWRIALKDRPVIEASAMALTLDEVNLSHGVAPGRLKRYRINQKYPWRGAHARAINHCNGATIPLGHSQSKTAYTVEVRVFNDGAAFRYIIPGTDRPRAPDEGTTFTLPANCTVWYHDLNGHYEGVHNKRRSPRFRLGNGPRLLTFNCRTAPVTHRLRKRHS
jgi:alpha-glucosidase